MLDDQPQSARGEPVGINPRRTRLDRSEPISRLLDGADATKNIAGGSVPSRDLTFGNGLASWGDIWPER